MIIFVDDPVPEPLDLTRWVSEHRSILIVAGSVSIVASLIGAWYVRKCCKRRASRGQRTRKSMQFPRVVAASQRYPGLKNLGNSCYLNAILQSLASLPNLAFPIWSPFTQALVDILMALSQKGNGTLDPSKLIKCIGGRLNTDQQDAQELLQAILSIIDKRRAVKATAATSASQMIAVSSPVSIFPPRETLAIQEESLNVWEGLQISVVKCTNCKKTSDCGASSVSFSILTLNPETNLEVAFQHFIQPDPIADYHCSFCGRAHQAFKLTNIIRWPRILIIHVQRTRRAGFALTKDDRFIAFPERMVAWTQDGHLLGIGQINRPEYHLMAVVEHTGAMGSGHYVAYRRVFEGNACRWLFCSDASVEEVSLEQVLAAQSYLIFYTQI